jgi:hypothetical protein
MYRRKIIGWNKFMINYKGIVAEAWHFTQENKRLVVWYGALPAFFVTVVGICYIVYQYYAFLSSTLFENWNNKFLYLVFTTALNFVNANRGLIVPLLVTAAVLAICYFFIPVIMEGGLIQMIARKKNGQDVPTRKGVYFGLIYFLPLFEYRLFIQTFSIVSMMSIMATSLRTFGWTIMPTLVPVFIFVMVVILILAIFFTYTEFYIVIDEEGPFTAITKSFDLVVRNLEETLLITVLMLIIGIRIIIQILFVLLIPAVVIGVVYVMALANLPNLGLALGAGIGIVGLIVASYLNGIIHVFAISVWTLTFLKLTTEVDAHARDQSKK